MRIPHDALEAATLAAVIEEFVSREGTEYGSEEVPLATKVAQVRRQLERGEAWLVFDPDSGSCNIVPAGTEDAAHG